MTRALVLSGETPAACAVVRGLHAAGLEPVVLAQSALSPAVYSWQCSASERVGRWLPDDLPPLVERLRPAVVVPVTEADLLRLAPVRERVESIARVVAPTPAALDLATDKVDGIAACAAAGVPVPEQWVLQGAPGDDGSLPSDLFPAVAKPSRSRILLPDGTVWGGTARYVLDAGDLRTLRQEHASAGLATVVQRPLPGGGLGVAVLIDGAGRPSLVFAHRRVRELRPEGGPSACADSVRTPETLLAHAVTAARALGLVGVPVQFEFRGAASSFRLLDVNPRPWGTLGLALACGVNFTGAAAAHALGAALPPDPPAYPVGVRRHCGPFELRRALTVAFGRRQRGYEGPWPSRVGALLPIFYPPWRDLVGRIDDPLPAVADLARQAVGLFLPSGR